jgi:DnaJ-class molecular chaperone
MLNSKKKVLKIRMPKDYYKILGVEKNANEDEIKKAFRKLAHQYHPDKKGGDEAKFKEVNEAYSVLSDKTKRSQYDTFGSSGAHTGGAGGFDPNGFGFDFSGFSNGEGFDAGDLGDILSSIFGGRRVRRGRDVAVDIELSFAESIFGTERKVMINSKAVKQNEVTIRVPAGIDNGQMIRMSGMGETLEGGVPGDLYVKVHVRRHPHLRKEGYNLLTDLNIKLTEGLLGTTKPIGTLDGEIELKIPAGTNTGTVLRVKGKGVPQSKDKRGDLFVRVTIVYPEKLSKEAKRLVEELKKEGV